MLEYLNHHSGYVLRKPVMKTYHTKPVLNRDWTYELVRDRLYSNYDEILQLEVNVSYLCPCDPLALGYSPEGILLLTRRGFFLFQKGIWIVTHQATVKQFYNSTGTLIYPELGEND